MIVAYMGPNSTDPVSKPAFPHQKNPFSVLTEGLPDFRRSNKSRMREQANVALMK